MLLTIGKFAIVAALATGFGFSTSSTANAQAPQVAQPDIRYETISRSELRVEVTGIPRCDESTAPVPVEVFLRNGGVAGTTTYQCEEWGAESLDGPGWLADFSAVRPRFSIATFYESSGLRRFRYRVRVDGVTLASGSISIRVRRHPAHKISDQDDIDNFINVCINDNHTVRSENGGHLYCYAGGWTERIWRVNGKIVP